MSPLYTNWVMSLPTPKREHVIAKERPLRLEGKLLYEGNENGIQFSLCLVSYCRNKVTQSAIWLNWKNNLGSSYFVAKQSQSKKHLYQLNLCQVILNRQHNMNSLSGCPLEKLGARINASNGQVKITLTLVWGKLNSYQIRSQNVTGKNKFIISILIQYKISKKLKQTWQQDTYIIHGSCVR